MDSQLLQVFQYVKKSAEMVLTLPTMVAMMVTTLMETDAHSIAQLKEVTNVLVVLAAMLTNVMRFAVMDTSMKNMNAMMQIISMEMDAIAIVWLRLDGIALLVLFTIRLNALKFVETV